MADRLTVRLLDRQEYLPTLEAMRNFTDHRDKTTTDEIWVVEHPPVFTQGQAGKPDHLLTPGEIPVIQSDRGGQVTFHGPGQLVVYLLIDIRRRQLGVRQLVDLIENAIITLLKGYGIASTARSDAPGVYVNGSKIASLGLRIRNGCSYHGLSLNIAMDLEPFNRIHPCGLQGIGVTQLCELGGPGDLQQVADSLLQILSKKLGYTEVITIQQPLHS